MESLASSDRSGTRSTQGSQVGRNRSGDRWRESGAMQHVRYQSQPQNDGSNYPYHSDNKRGTISIETTGEISDAARLGGQPLDSYSNSIATTSAEHLASKNGDIDRGTDDNKRFLAACGDRGVSASPKPSTHLAQLHKRVQCHQKLPRPQKA